MKTPLLVLSVLVMSACAYNGQNANTRVASSGYFYSYGGQMSPFYNDPYYMGYGAFSPYPVYGRPDWRASYMYPGRYNGHHHHHHWAGRHGGHRGHR